MNTTLISTADLAQRLGSPGLVLIDVRHDLAHPDAWGEGQYRAAHLPGAVFLHIDRDLSAAKTGTNGRHPLPSPEACAKLFGRIGIDATTDVVAYDQSQGMYAARVWWMLRWLGHDRVRVLDGGFDKWQREGRPVTSEIAQPQARVFVPRPRDVIVDAAGVRANLDARTLLLLDARAPERFRGEVEPLDPVAGHIPGAANRPGSRNLGTDGTFKPAEALRAEFLALLGNRAPETIVHQCGSGITACHNLLAMEVAGLHGSRLYPGSWSEWCADPSRPIARGEP
jgi:thiosulfate/3-mercaptopyruvate sulfurtransferase